MVVTSFKLMVLSIYGSADHSGGQSVEMQHANFAR